MDVKCLVLRGAPGLVTGMTVTNAVILVKCFLLLQEAQVFFPLRSDPFHLI